MALGAQGFLHALVPRTVERANAGHIDPQDLGRCGECLGAVCCVGWSSAMVGLSPAFGPSSASPQRMDWFAWLAAALAPELAELALAELGCNGLSPSGPAVLGLAAWGLAAWGLAAWGLAVTGYNGLSSLACSQYHDGGAGRDHWS